MLLDSLQFIEGADWNYDIAGATLSQPTNNAVLGRFRATRAFKIPINANGSTFSSETAPTALTTYILKKNGVQFGTVAFQAAQNASVFTIASETLFAINDVFTIEAPAVVDSTHDKLSWTIKTLYTV